MKSDPKHDDERGLDRRGFLAAAAGVAGLTAMAPDAFARNFGSNAEPVRYSDPDIIAHDPRFKAKLGNTPIRRRYTGTLWAEGPAWNGVGRYLIWSDIPSNEQLCLIKEDGHVSRRFRSPQATQTAIRLISAVGRYPVNMAIVALCGMNTMGRRLCWLTPLRTKVLTPRTMLSFIQMTALFGSLIPVMAG